MQDAEIKLAKLNGSYDECGIIKPHGESIAFKKKEVGCMSDPCLLYMQRLSVALSSISQLVSHLALASTWCFDVSMRCVRPRSRAPCECC